MYPLYKVFTGQDDSCRRIVKFTGPTTGYDWYSSTGDSSNSLESGWIPHDRGEWRSFKSIEEGLLGLPAAYRSLAIQRMKEQPDFSKTHRSYQDPSRNLLHAFDWEKTPEGHEFWDQVYTGKNPEIPEVKEEVIAPVIRITTTKRPGLTDLILDILKEKGIEVGGTDLQGEEEICFATVSTGDKDAQLWSRPSSFSPGNYEVISYFDFIRRIENLPVKKKKKQAMVDTDLIDGYDVQFNPSGSVSIGCQLFDEENIERIIREIGDWRETKVVAKDGYSLELSEKGICINGDEIVSFADFDKFREKLGAYKQS